MTNIREVTGSVEDGIWRAIERRIDAGYSGVGELRESEANADVRAAIEAIRADERAVIAEAVEPSVRWGEFATLAEKYAYQCGVIDGKHDERTKVPPLFQAGEFVAQPSDARLELAINDVIEWIDARGWENPDEWMLPENMSTVLKAARE